MTSLRTRTRMRVFGSENSWSLTPHPQVGGEGQECSVDLEIVGDPQTGYHLVKCPSGFFAADDWYLTLEEALEAGLREFGIGSEDWSEGSADEAS
jgi:hypothetical protein